MNSKTKMIFFFLFSAGILFSGCAATGKKVAQKDKQSQTPAETSPVQLLWDRPAVPFMIIGRVQASAPVETPDEALYVALQKEGEKLFANAVVVQQGGIQAIRSGDEVKKQASGWAISYTSHEPIHRMPGAPKTEEEEDAEEQSTPTGFGLLP